MPIPARTPALPRRLLRDEAYDRIAEGIVRGQFAPGERLNDQDLAEWMGISRTPVREALARLERTGLVHTVPGRETIVSELDPATTDHAVRVAAALHALAVHDAAAGTSPSDVKAMQAANRRLQQAFAAEDVVAAIAADDAFHQVAIARAANPVLESALDQVMPLLRRAEHLRFGAFITPDSVQQHAAILAALQAHDADAAVEASAANWSALHS
ncbi:MAG: GntR family transcriptional regulator [Pseudoclavibacter sp.]